MSAIEDLLAKVKPATASVRVCLRGDLLGELDLVNDDLALLEDWEPSGLSDVDPRTEKRARKAEIEQEMREASAVFTFQGVGDKAWSDLHVAHPPPAGKEEETDFDPQTFPAALIAAASVDPKMTVEEVEKLFDSFTLTQRNQVFSCSYRANVRGVDIPFSLAASNGAAVSAKKSK